MKIDAKSAVLRPRAERSPAVLPRPSRTVTFNFDQGIAAEETFPMEELER